VPEAIFRIAMEQLEHRDVGELSLRGLAREIGVSATAVYRHFADKTELVAAAEVQARLTALGRAYLEFAVSAPELFRVMFGKEAAAYRRRRAAESAEAASKGFSSFNTRVSTFRYLEKAMRDLGSTGVIIRADEGGVINTWALIHGYSHLLVGGDIGTPQRIAEDVVARVIASRGAPSI
jgi:AcrR family transcriptional regulator